ncbi:MAG: helix-turn-helix domain-containing protein [Acidobacteria bacterium]|nr:helix-turn-helix domain-containing protein [Acidobacteriota bacterium]
MGRIKRVELDDEQHNALEAGYQDGTSHALRRRCQMILLTSQGRTSSEIAGMVGGCHVAVNHWVKRYQEEGIAGLRTRQGRGRKAILQECALEAVQAAVQEHRQRLSVAKAELEQTLGKSFCRKTLADFVKQTVVVINASAAINASANGPAASRCRRFTNFKSKR